MHVHGINLALTVLTCLGHSLEYPGNEKLLAGGLGEAGTLALYPCMRLMHALVFVCVYLVVRCMVHVKVCGYDVSRLWPAIYLSERLEGGVFRAASSYHVNAYLGILSTTGRYKWGHGMFVLEMFYLRMTDELYWVMIF